MPLIYKEADIHILDNTNQTQFGLRFIEYNRVYNGRWNTDELNRNDYNESGEIKFFIENWILHPIDQHGDPYWTRRHEHFFRILQSDYDTGLFSFAQIIRFLKRFKFVVSIIAVRKQTQNLNITYTSSLLSFMPNLPTIKELCHYWHAKTSEIVEPNDLKSCPCTLESARIDPNLHVDFTCSSTERHCHENLNAHRCFLEGIKYVYT